MSWSAVILAVLLVPVAALATLWLIGERGHLMLPSTRAALRSRRCAGPDGGPRSAHTGRGAALLNTLHGYIYGRWPYQYISFFVNAVLPRLRPSYQGFRRWWADHYHGKVLPTELARAIITLDHDIPRTDLERIIPYPTARDLVLKGPPGVTLLECPCRHARESPCGPTDVCMIFGESGFALDHHPNRARRVSQDEALAVLEAEHRRGHVHTAYFKDACDHRFYAICNCCKCCCGGLEAMVKYGVPMVASSGYVARVDELACIGCGECRDACPFEAVALVDDRAWVTWEKCLGCGVCEGRCDTGAMALVRDRRKGIPLDVREIGVEAAAIPA